MSNILTGNNNNNSSCSSGSPESHHHHHQPEPSSTARRPGLNNLISLKWNDSEAFILTQIRKLWNKMEMTDVILSCEGRIFKAHKLILSIWSPYFQQLFDVTSAYNGGANPVIIFRDTLAVDLELLLQFMYQGQVYIGQRDADRFLKTGEILQIAGWESIRKCTAAVISPPVERDKPQTQDFVTSNSATNVNDLHQEQLTRSRGLTKGFQAVQSIDVNYKVINTSPNVTKESTSTKQSECIKTRSAPTLTSRIPLMREEETHNLSRIKVPAPTTTVAFSSIFATNTTSSITTSSSHGFNHSEEDSMMLGQVMQLQMEPIPIQEVEEAVAAANASSSVQPDGQSLMLLSLSQDEMFQDQEVGRHNMSNNNSLLSSGSTISPYTSYIIPDLEHPYTNTISESGTVTFSSPFGNEGVIIPQQQVTILQQQSISGIHLQEGISSNQFQLIQQQQQHQPANVEPFQKDQKRVVQSGSEIQFIQCPKCNKFVKEQSLKVHLKRSHLAEGVILTCPLCPKQLKSRGVYYKHMFLHRQKGEVPVKSNKASQKQTKIKQNGKESKKSSKKESSAVKGSDIKPTTSKNGGGGRGVESKEADPRPSSSVTSSSRVILYRLQPSESSSPDGANSQNTTTISEQEYQYEFDQL